MRLVRYISVLTAVLLCCAGCIRENIDDCETPVEVEFLYWGDGIVDVFPERVDSVLMFIYEASSGELYRTVPLTASELDARQGASLRLFPGDYRLVCWGNAGEGSYIDLDAQRIMSADHHEGRNPSGIEELYFGSTELSVPLTLRPVRDTVEFEAPYIMMTVELLGFGRLNSGGASAGQTLSGDGEEEPKVIFAHEGLSGHIDFNGDPVLDEELADYVPELEDHPEEADSYTTTYLVPEFDNSTTSELSVYDRARGTSLYNRPLADILDELGITLDPDRNELALHLRIQASFDSNGVLVGVDVVGWNTEIVYPEF